MLYVLFLIFSDSGYEEEVDYEDVEIEFAMTSTEEDAFLKTFREWLQSVDGGMKPIRSTKQHSNVVMSMAHFTDPSGKDYSCLLQRAPMNSWVTNFEAKGRQPGTIKTYLGSLKLFYRFLTITNPSYVDSDPKMVIQMKEIVDQWSRNYAKKVEKAKNAKQLDELSKLPTPEDIKKLDSSDHQKGAIKTLTTFLSIASKTPTRKEFCLCRDYLITNIILDNASRSGCISNMTLKEFDNAEFQQSDCSSIIFVHEHKTSYNGPAMLSLSATLMEHLTVFVEKVRNKVPDMSTNENHPVFISWSGRQMAVSMVAQQLNMFWKHSTLQNLEHRMTANRLRKMTVSVVHTNAPELKKPLANLMNHDVRTAEKKYLLEDKKRKVADTCAKVRELVRTDFSSKSTELKDEELLSIFGNETVTMQLVREKRVNLPEHSVVNSLSDRQLYDKVNKYFIIISWLPRYRNQL